MLNIACTLVNIVIVITSILLIVELFRTIKRTLIAFELIDMVEKLICFSKKIVLEKNNREDNENFLYDANEFFAEEDVEINGNLLIVNGLELNFDKDLVEQFKNIHEVLIYMIYCEWKRLIFKREMLKRCKNFEQLISNLNVAINFYESKI